MTDYYAEAQRRFITLFERIKHANLTEPAGMGKWLKRHEARLTAMGAVIRLGNAWRIIEPAFRPAMLAILTEERNKAQRKK